MSNNKNFLEAISIMQEMLEMTKISTSIMENGSEDFLRGYLHAVNSIVAGLRFELRAIELTGNGKEEATFIEKRIDQYSEVVSAVNEVLAVKQILSAPSRN